ncbi:MAG: DNA (cytosine-5-)-methyltransferase [Bacillota bacterium]|nr:DNA (cytosine-5-)-methyltransferase [Bacillota bacterium]
MSSKIKFIDLFSGIGGIRIGFENNNCECVFSSDIDEKACETYQLNFGEYPLSDITKVKLSEIPQFDILCAGFPCQPFSIAGKRLGFEDTRGTLFFEVARILKNKKPKAFLLENVKGITNHDGGKTLKTIENVLTNLGYKFEWKIINAKDFGIPQNRERWYCVGFKKSLFPKEGFNWPEKLEKEIKLEDIIKNVDKEEYKVSDICIKNIEKGIENKKIEIKNTTLAYEIRASRCQFSNGVISPCLTAKMGTGGNNVPVVVSQKRKLTEKECLGIMGFPKKYKFNKGYQTYKQIGNSVVVPIIDAIANKMVEVLDRG